MESTQKGLENGEERGALLARPKLIIDGRCFVTLPLTGNARCTERSACENPNHRGLCDSANIHYIDMHLRRQCRDVESQETQWNIRICTKVLNPHS